MHQKNTARDSQQSARDPQRESDFGSTRTFILPIDFSPPSLAALEYAAHFAEGRGSNLRLIHAVTPTSLEDAVAAHDLLIESAIARLERLAQSLRRRGFQIHCEARVGAPVDMLIDAVDRHASHDSESRETMSPIVVMGDRGQSAIRRTLLGSVADTALRRLRCPIMIVHEHDVAAVPMRAVVAYGFDRESENALQVFLSLVRSAEHTPRVELVHALPDYEWVEGTEVPLLRTSAFDDVEKLRAEEMHAIAEVLRKQGIDATSAVVRGEPTQVLLRRANDLRADLLVLGRRPRRALERFVFGSVSEGVAHRSHCAVLTACALPVAAATKAKALIVT